MAGHVGESRCVARCCCEERQGRPGEEALPVPGGEDQERAGEAQEEACQASGGKGAVGAEGDAYEEGPEGVVALRTPAIPESTCCSPRANRAKGRALQKRAAMARWRQVDLERGRRWPALRARRRSTAVPRAQRVTVIWVGVRPWVRDSLIQRKPEPQKRASAAMRRVEGMALTVACSMYEDK